jgi:hypothetical protein
MPFSLFEHLVASSVVGNWTFQGIENYVETFQKKERTSSGPIGRLGGYIHVASRIDGSSTPVMKHLWSLFRIDSVKSSGFPACLRNGLQYKEQKEGHVQDDSGMLIPP